MKFGNVETQHNGNGFERKLDDLDGVGDPQVG
jgi:hypothetical protein